MAENRVLTMLFIEVVQNSGFTIMWISGYACVINMSFYSKCTLTNTIISNICVWLP